MDNQVPFEQKMQQVNVLLQMMEPFYKIFEYQDLIKRLMSEGVMYMLLMSEMKLEMTNEFFEANMEFLETKRNTELAVDNYIKDVLTFIHAHKSKQSKGR
ncbi:hypothetical protein HB762_26825 (plasmid) [Vibrio campbellii]|uniref:Uncharacterized protein n=1 Tax=Vibrio campbellii TaxID=680 RepID=A0ABY5IKQ1_9VIBR|nr:hypothetical protein [Vibrio campbellii]UTZ34878.1 hypothetical protein HB762_26825 [Vibrio campbellii]